MSSGRHNIPLVRHSNIHLQEAFAKWSALTVEEDSRVDTASVPAIDSELTRGHPTPGVQDKTWLWIESDCRPSNTFLLTLSLQHAPQVVIEIIPKVAAQIRPGPGYNMLRSQLQAAEH